MRFGAARMNRPASVSSTESDLLGWLQQRSQSNRCCNHNSGSCEMYHSLAPALHQIGLFLSYERYSKFICETVRKFAIGKNPPRIVVVGVESEFSAAAFLNALPVDVAIKEIVFADRCLTPLLRIQSKLKCSHWPINVMQADLTISGQMAAIGAAEVIVGDSILKQFSGSAKHEVVRNLAAIAAPDKSMLLLREYVGTLSEILPDFWCKLPYLIKTSTLFKQASPSTVDCFIAATAELNAYMLSIGHAFENHEELTLLLNGCGWGIVQMQRDRDKHYTVLEAQK